MHRAIRPVPIGVLGMAAAALIASSVPWMAMAESPAGVPRLFTDQQYVEDVLAVSDIDVSDPKAVLKLVLGSLPDTAKVYPTENYFYFHFYHGGIKWAGNLRFDVETRDEGKLHMTYFKDFTGWQQDHHDYTVVWSAEDGVTVEKLKDLVYRVSYAGNSVIFELNDLSMVRPPPGAVRPEERYLGPVFDESGIRFFLVFNPEPRVFHFILDETVRPADEFFLSDISPDIKIGRRTGFALFKDRFAERQILIGVHANNARVNNYLDGPFDQLPDNFLKGDALRDAILTVSPELEGTIDRFGNSQDDTVRYLIAPYMQYEQVYELGLFEDCAGSETPPLYYACFSLGPGPDDGLYANEPPPYRTPPGEPQPEFPPVPSREPN